jgi:CBS domain containing-hemolysin-like protein
MVHAAIRRGVVQRDLGEYLQAALELPELRLRNAMVPRVDVVAVPDDCSAADAARRMAAATREQCCARAPAAALPKKTSTRRSSNRRA